MEHEIADETEQALLDKIAEMKEAGYSYKEISKIVELSPMAVRSRWRRLTGTHLRGSRTATEAATKPGANMKPPAKKVRARKPVVKIATQVVPEGVEVQDVTVAQIAPIDVKNGWARLPTTSRHVVAYVPNRPDRLRSVKYSICSVPEAALSRIQAHDEYFYFDIPELV
jgi:hypothetical protein